MGNLILRELTEVDGSAFLAGLEDWKEDDLSWYSFVWKPGMSHAEHLQTLEDQKDKRKIPSNRVPSTMLYGFVNGEIIGRFNIRHELNPYLLERGGHVGYSVGFRHRRKGYATEMFRQGLMVCKALGLEKILVTCADQNKASWKIIERFGGSLENRIYDEKDQEFVRRYWLSTSHAENSREVKEKVVAYITRQQGERTQLLVFNHNKDHSEAGTQVPAGTIDSGEDPVRALLREIEEEAGITQLDVRGKIDEYTFFREVHQCFNRRHVFHLTSKTPLPEKWSHVVSGNGIDQNLNFHYYWMNLDEVKGRLSGRFDDSIDVLSNLLADTNGVNKPPAR